MHELSITQQILDIALQKATEANSGEIKQINIVIGEMSSVVDDCVQFYFDFLSKGTAAQNARLNFKRIPISLKCRNCRHIFSPDGIPWTCPLCRKSEFDIEAGNEFYMDSIEVEE